MSKKAVVADYDGREGGRTSGRRRERGEGKGSGEKMEGERIEEGMGENRRGKGGIGEGMGETRRGKGRE